MLLETFGPLKKCDQKKTFQTCGFENLSYRKKVHTDISQALHTDASGASGIYSTLK